MKLYRGGGSGVALILATGVLLTNHSNVNAQTNSWISPTSGNWEDAASWSLGVLPGANQTILITNSGWKAVSIGQNTAHNYPQTLSVDSITISSPTNSVNSLLLNFVGVDSPLVANSLTLNENSVLTLHSSALNVYSNLSIGGTFNQNDFSGVFASRMQIGDVGPATYIMSNGTLTVTNLEVLGGWGHTSVFDQEGGYHYATPLWINGEYDLRDGQLGGTVLLKGGVLNQYGGDLSVSSFPVDGFYNLFGGTFESSGDFTVNQGFVTQSGGTLSSGSFSLGGTYGLLPGFGTYTISNGILNVASNAFIDYQGNLDQEGGTINIAGQLTVVDSFLNTHPGDPVGGIFSQNGGTFSANSVSLEGRIVQNGGTNEVAGDLLLDNGPANYTLTGGFLSTSNTLKTEGSFHQSGGVHSVQNLLSVKNPLGYEVSGGQINAPYMEIDNSSFVHSGGTINNSAVLIMNFGRWVESAPAVQLGRLRVTGSGFPSTLAFATNPCVVHFLASSGQVWSNNVGLNIENWAGSLNGGGQSQVIFGNNSSGLSASQLAHVQFTFSQGNFPAKILSSGEVVPVLSGPPFYPTEVTATAMATNRIDLTWTDNALNEYGYSIERSLDGTNFVQICTPPANATNYSDTDLSAGARYYYRIQAQTIDANSAFSDIATATTKFNPPLAGMIAWWRADGSAEDSIGTHDAPTPFGSSYSTGKVNQAFDLPGIGNKLIVPDSPDFVLTNAFSIEGWIYPHQTDFGLVAMRGDARVGHDSWILGMTNTPGDLSFIITSDSNESAEIDAPIQTNQWQHFAATFDATNGMKLYINGVLAAQTNTTVRPIGVLNSNDAPGLCLGNSCTVSNWLTFIGLLDEVALYSRALTPAEIQNIYNAGGAGKLALVPTKVTLGQQTGGAMQLHLNGPAGRSYEFDISTDLVHWVPWHTQLNNSGSMTINDNSATNSPIKFYRAVPLP
jgi:concanavalin A-like lectin/glucanase superfamily protein